MKKYLSLIVILALILSIRIPAFAAEGSQNVAANQGTASINIPGTYAASAATAEKISVDIAWGAMSFTYTDAFQGTWDPTSHRYTDAAEAKWVATGNTITVKNHSNATVKATMFFTATEGLNVTGSFDKSELNLATAVGTAYENAPSDTATLTISGSIVESTDKMGTVTVTITADSVSTAQVYEAGNTVSYEGEEYVVLEVNDTNAVLIGKTAGNDTASQVKNSGITLATADQVLTAYSNQYISMTTGTSYICNEIPTLGTNAVQVDTITFDGNTIGTSKTWVSGSNQINYFPIVTVEI